MDLTAAWEKIQGMIEDLVRALPNIGLALVVFVLFYALGAGIRVLVRRLTEQRRRNVGLVLGRLAHGLAIFIGFLVSMGIVFPSVNARSLIELLGISSVAIGFAFRDVLQNFLSGILILLTEPFRIGDQIVVGGFEGTVEDIQTRATTIRTYDGRRVVIPNSSLFTDSVIVNTAFDRRRLEYDVGIGYGDDIGLAKRLMVDAMRSVPEVLAEPAPDALVMELAESSVLIRARWWIKPPSRASALDTRDQVLAAIKNQLVENGIDLPFPTRQILFHDQTEATDGDRTRQREGWPAGQGLVPRARSTAVALNRWARKRRRKNRGGAGAGAEP